MGIPGGSKRQAGDRVDSYSPDGRIAQEQAVIPHFDRATLERELREVVTGEVRFDDGSRALYATDSSNYRQVPVGVVIPKSREDVVRTVAICREHGLPILPRGGGTSLAGECTNVAVVIDFSKYLNRVIEIDPERRIARVEPGCILDHLRDAAKEYGLTFGPDPATHDHNTLGGMIGNNSGGVHAPMHGITVFNVEALEVLTYDGLRMRVGPTSEEELRAILSEGGRRAEVYAAIDRLRRANYDLIVARYPEIPRRVSGYENLDQLFPEKGFNVARSLVGTEGTCVVVLEATLTLIPDPPCRAVTLIGFPDIGKAGDAVPKVMKRHPIGLEGWDDTMVERYKVKGLHKGDLNILPPGKGWLLVEVGADTDADAKAQAERIAKDFEGVEGVCPKVVTDPGELTTIWAVRDDSLGAESYVPNHPDTWPGWEDSAVPPDRLGDYIRDLLALFHRYGYHPVIYGHFAGGVVHCAVAFDLYDEPGIDAWSSFLNEAAHLVTSYGGSLSGEHGDGQARGALLEIMYGPEMVEVFREFKRIWDPEGRMNPGKIIDPFPITSNLRVGPSYRPPLVETHFSFREEGGFDRAAQRCVGVGKCRRHDSGDEVMCPSFLVTHEEMHSTRGRSRMLFEMLHGGPIDDLWNSREVEQALSLCLACKGCKSDCPVNVDMATYKAEFRSHHYARRLRPRHAYSMGLIHRWAGLASHAPRLANFLTQTPGLRDIAKAVGGIAKERTLPAFAPEPFTTWFRKHGPAPKGRPRVLLWPDTFNNFFRPDTAKAAVRVLEAAGYDVTIPTRNLCCGRPLYDWGFLDRAKGLWRDTLDALGDDIVEGIPVVGLEPACVAAFKDELLNLYPDHQPAKKLSRQTFFLSDFLADHWPDRLSGSPDKALVQMHCHQHAVIKDKGEKAVLDRLGLDYEMMQSGCCGMAGAFGFAAETYEISMAAGERVLLPKVRASAADTLILANGFSCREQIEQATGRPTLHIAELLARRL